MQDVGHTLGHRLGLTVHVSPLRFKLQRLRERFPPAGDCIEDWLLQVANARGARVVVPPHDRSACFTAPPLEALSEEELAVAICQLNGLDRPQLLRLAAQMISRGSVAPVRLRLVAERERAGAVLAELARQALKVEPEHAQWQAVAALFKHAHPLREPLLHWTRLAEPMPQNGRCNAAAWRLVA
jgi:hypothetical protein